MIDNNLWARSLCFEIRELGSSPKSVRVWTMAIPPDSISISEPQRISVTKTFGGAVIDDYGPDLMRISISGTTLGNEERVTWVSEGDTALATYSIASGRSDMFQFRDKILRYKTTYANWKNTQLILYDLTSPKGDQSGSNIFDKVESYVCILQDFSISRSKERPLYYNYKIELIGLWPYGDGKSTGASLVAAWVTTNSSALAPVADGGLSGVAKKLTVIQQLLAGIQTVYGASKDANRRIRELTVGLDSLSAGIATWVDPILGIVNELSRMPYNIADQVLNEVDSFRDYVLATTVQGWKTISGVESNVILVAERMTATIASTMATVVATLKRLRRDSTPDTHIRVIEDTLVTSSDLATEMVAELQLRSIAMGVSSDVDSRGVILMQDESIAGDVALDATRVISTYGSQPYLVTDGTTLDRLAIEIYGDASMSELIAQYNSISNDAELVPGNTIQIPNLQPVNNSRNLVYSLDVGDVYGTDCLLSFIGELMPSPNGDLALVGDKTNVVQALNLRLGEPIGQRLKLGLYGIRASIGQSMSSTAAISYVAANVRETLMLEPRVQNVTGLELRANGDQLQIKASITLVSRGDTIQFQGVS